MRYLQSYSRLHEALAAASDRDDALVAVDDFLAAVGDP